MSLDTIYFLALFAAWVVWFSASTAPRLKLIACAFIAVQSGILSGICSMLVIDFTDLWEMTACLFNVGMGVYFVLQIPAQREAMRAAKEARP